MPIVFSGSRGGGGGGGGREQIDPIAAMFMRGFGQGMDIGQTSVARGVGLKERQDEEAQRRSEWDKQYGLQDRRVKLDEQAAADERGAREPFAQAMFGGGQQGGGGEYPGFPGPVGGGGPGTAPPAGGGPGGLDMAAIAKLPVHQQQALWSQLQAAKQIQEIQQRAQGAGQEIMGLHQKGALGQDPSVAQTLLAELQANPAQADQVLAAARKVVQTTIDQQVKQQERMDQSGLLDQYLMGLPGSTKFTTADADRIRMEFSLDEKMGMGQAIEKAHKIIEDRDKAEGLTKEFDQIDGLLKEGRIDQGAADQAKAKAIGIEPDKIMTPQTMESVARDFKIAFLDAPPDQKIDAYVRLQARGTNMAHLPPLKFETNSAEVRDKTLANEYDVKNAERTLADAKARAKTDKSTEAQVAVQRAEVGLHNAQSANVDAREKARGGGPNNAPASPAQQPQTKRFMPNDAVAQALQELGRNADKRELAKRAREIYEGQQGR